MFELFLLVEFFVLMQTQKSNDVACFGIQVTFTGQQVQELDVNRQFKSLLGSLYKFSIYVQENKVFRSRDLTKAIR